MKTLLLQTVREYFLAIILTVLFCNVLPYHYVESMQSSLFYVLGLVPITFTSILLTNLATMIVIFVLGMLHREFVSFFVVLNGVAFGLVISYYQTNLVKLFTLLFPHSIFETTLIILFCTIAKVSIYGFRGDNRISQKYLWILLCLWVFSAFLERGFR